MAESYTSQEVRDSYHHLGEIFSQLAHYINEVFYILSADWCSIIYMSPSYENIWGRSLKSIYEDPRSFINAIHPQDKDKIEHLFSETPESPIYIEFRIIRPDGSIRWIRSRNYPIRDSNGKVYRIAGTNEDITEKRVTEKKLRQSEEKFQDLFNNIEDLYYRADLEGRLLLASPALEKITGYEPEDVLGKRIDEVFYKNPEERHDLQEKVLRDGQVNGSEVQLIHRQGHIVWVSITSHVYTDSDGSVQGIEGLVRDISHLKRTEKQLLHRLRWEEAVAETSSYIATSDNPKLDKVLEKTAQMINADRAAIYTCNFEELTCRPLTEWHKSINEESRFSEICLHKYTWFKNQIQQRENILISDVHDLPPIATYEKESLLNHGVKSILAIPIVTVTGQTLGFIEYDTRDEAREWNSEDILSLKVIAEMIGSHMLRQRSLKAMRKSERNFRHIFENMQEGFFRIDRNGTILLANPSFVELLGYESNKEIIGSSILDFHLSSRDDREVFFEHLRDAGVIKNYQGTLLNKNNNRIHYKVNAQAIENEEGELQFYDGTLEDITEEKQLEEQLIHSQKMEALGRLAGGIAHDFNNLLTVIEGYSSIALQKISESCSLNNDITMINQAGEQAKTLVSQLLAFSRKQVIELRIVDINQIINDAKNMFSRILGETIDLQTNITAESSLVKADPGQLEQMIMNLVVNAIDAMPEGGNLRIETHTDSIDSAVNTLDLKQGTYVCITVSDTGIGMDENTKKMIFEPVFTTKKSGEGTGLGLSTVFGVIEQLNGDITVESKIGEGTTFKIYLPVARGKQPLRNPKSPKINNLNLDREILLVEDQDELRHMVKGFLSEKGYRIADAATGSEALDICKRFSEKFHLLLTDIIMPDFTGPEVSKMIQKYFPDIKTLYMSGHHDDVFAEENLHTSTENFLRKPFTHEDLLKKIHYIFDQE